MDREGRSCNPRNPDCALSFHGAIMVACPTSYDADQLFEWLRFHRLIPFREPRTRAEALEVFDRALEEAGGA